MTDDIPQQEFGFDPSDSSNTPKKRKPAKKSKSENLPDDVPKKNKKSKKLIQRK